VKISAYWLQRRIAGGLVVLLTAPLLAQTVQPLPARQEDTSLAGQGQTPSNTTGQPGAETNQSVPKGSTPVKSPTDNATQDGPQSAPEPVGTAVAPYEKTVGVAASRPAGAVIAPAKQRRAHSLLIKLGLIAGGAAAIAVVVALSKASPSRPN
jgi:hypothetical protein